MSSDSRVHKLIKIQLKSEASKTKTNSKIVVLQSLSCDSILPTFTFKLHDDNLHGIKDNGSQSSFVIEPIATAYNLKILQKNLELVINKCNSPQKCRGKMVEVPFDLKGTKHLVSALVVAKIKVNLNLPKLKHVFKLFKEKSYHLANNYLN